MPSHCLLNTLNQYSYKFFFSWFINKHSTVCESYKQRSISNVTLTQNVIIVGRGEKNNMLISQVIKSQNEYYFNTGKYDLQDVTDKELCDLYI